MSVGTPVVVPLRRILAPGSAELSVAEVIFPVTTGYARQNDH
jgi:hypothetical protein